MPVIISMLRGVNVGGHNKIKMEELRALYEDLGFKDPRSYIQSGNVVFETNARNLVALTEKIEKAIEKTFGFRPAVILRTADDLRAVVARNPFADREGIEPNKLLVTFLPGDPGREAREKVLAIKTDPEELRIDGRELYIYFPNGAGTSKLSIPLIDRTLKMSGTSRNWNSVLKLLEMAS